MRFQHVIDLHTHPFTLETLYGQGLSFTEGHEFFGASPESPHAGLPGGLVPKSAAESFEELKRGGDVDLAVVVNMNAAVSWGHCLPNDYIAKYCREHPHLYLGMGGVDPNMPTRGALREVERCARMGLIGLKFHPAYQDFFPNDRKQLWPIYEKCVELDLTILVHTGTTRMTRCYIRSCKPEFLDEVATDFPQLRIIMTHFGWPWTDEALAVVWRHENVYLDLSGWLPRYIYAASPSTFQYMNTVLADKFVLGSDYPAIFPQYWLQDFAPFIEEGFEWGGKRREFKPESLQKFLRTNAVRALNLQKYRPEAVADPGPCVLPD